MNSIKVFLGVFLVLITTFSFLSFSPAEIEPTGFEIVKSMFAKSSTINTLQYTMKKRERIKGKMLFQQTLVKVHHKPLKVYLKQELPKAGLEVLYVHGTNGNQALVNTNGFPWMNLSLDPMGSIMRENQHHTLLESGYSHMVSILELLTKKYGKEAEGFMKNMGTVSLDGRSCWYVVFTNPHFAYQSYTLKEGETVLSIAAKAKLSEHMILEKNPKMDNFNDASPGETIIIPNDYSPKLELYIDKEFKMPLLMKVYDDKGLYEHYEYKNVLINPAFAPDEFTKNFSAYNF